MLRFFCRKNLEFGFGVFSALVALCAAPNPADAAAIWSADAAVINAANPGAAPAFGAINFIGNNFTGIANVGGGLTLGNGNSYTFAGTFAEKTTANSALMVLNNFTITAAATNVGLISDTMWFFSDTFNAIGPRPGFVGMSGAFLNPFGGYGYAQAQMDYNGSFGGLPATAFLTTLPVYSGGAAFAPFIRLTTGFIPVSTTELTGLLAFTLAPGESITLPFDFSDNDASLPGVPEPNSILLMGLGVLPIALVAVYKSKRQSNQRTRHQLSGADAA
jgi:hypothetical protein